MSDNFPIKPELLAPLSLAYLGDAVLELMVRDKLVEGVALTPASLNNRARSFVSAVAQSEAYYKLLPHLTEEEEYVIKRGRNAKSSQTPKSATPAEHHNATGLEALFGYLYLLKRRERLEEIFDLCYKSNEV